MFTLSLDENGDFEGFKKDKKDAIIIGGVLFDDGDNKNELSTEKKRIRQFYKSVIRDAAKKSGVKLLYPKSLHSSKNEDSKKHEGIVKSSLEKKLPEFLRYGTYNKQELCDDNGNEFAKRKGKYYIYTILKSEIGKRKCLSDGSDYLLNDGYASNLYFHMAMDTMGRTIFYNPYAEKGSKFDLHIATRSTPTFEKNSEIAAMYSNLGYKGVDFRFDKKAEKGKAYFTIKNSNGEMVPAIRYDLTNADVYRTGISLYATDNNPYDMQVTNLEVKSIEYNDPKKKEYPFEMLYLADTVCSYLSHKIANDERKDADAWLLELVKRADKLLPKEQQLIFAYDDVDIKFMKALEYVRNDNYYLALKTCYKAVDVDNTFSKFYKERWFPFIQKMIAKSDNLDAFSKAVNDLYQSLFSNHYNSNLGIYALEVLEETAEQIKPILKTREGYRVIARLYEAAMTIYCHLGDSKSAEKYYKLLTQNYSDLIKLDDMLRIRDMLSVCYCDCFMWEKALELSTKTVDLRHSLSKLQKEMQPKMDLPKTSEGKSTSQLAQTYAFCRDRRAEGYFLNALDLLGKGSADYYITLSYLLHFYLDKKDQESFAIYAKEYFGNQENIESQLEYLLEAGLKEDSVISLKFALYVFVKSLYAFYSDDIPISLWKKLTDLEKYVNTKYKSQLKKEEVWKLTGHPKELIYKYITLLAIKRNDEEARKKYENELENWPMHSYDTISAIIEVACCDISKEAGNKIKLGKRISALKDNLVKNYPALKELEAVKDKKEVYEIVKTYFTYMYN